VDGGRLADALRQIQRSPDGGFTEITGLLTTNFEGKSDKVVRRFLEQLARQLEGVWEVIIEYKNGQRIAKLVRRS
jgi:hypothetical protein